jgi:tryptophan-rich sensory protein
MNEPKIYETWTQPFFAPPSWIFGPVWSVLYVIIAISYGWVFYKVFQGDLPKIVALPLIINLVANFSFTPVQFGLQNLPLAAVVILIVLGTILWSMWAMWPHEKMFVYAQIPYLLWVSFATVLQLTITYLNR